MSNSVTELKKLEITMHTVGSRMDRSWFIIKQDNPPLSDLLLLTVVSLSVCLCVHLYFRQMLWLIENVCDIMCIYHVM